MIYHYLKIAFRNLIKYKTQSIVSIVGLAIGFTCFALSALWIRYEMTYDTFHEGAERIYLAGNKFELQGDGFSYFSPNLLADYIKTNCPEVEKVCHIRYDSSRKPMKYKEGCKCQVESCSSFCLYGCFGYYLWIVQLFNDACYSYPNA